MYKPNYPYLKITSKERKLITISEAYLMYYNKIGYLPIIDVLDMESKENYFILISAKSLANQLEDLRNENNGRLNGLEFSIKKENDSSEALYVLE